MSSAEISEAVWDWLDDGFGRLDPVVATGRLGDYSMVQCVIRDGGRWLVTPPMTGEGLPTLVYKTSPAEVAHEAAAQTARLFRRPDIGAPWRRAHFWNETKSATFIVASFLGSHALALYILLTFDLPEWTKGKYGVLGATMFIWATISFLFAVVAGRLQARAVKRAWRRDARRHTASSFVASGQKWALTSSQSEAIALCLKERDARWVRAGQRTLSAVDPFTPIWAVAHGRRRYRRLFGPLSPAVRVCLLPRLTTILAPRSRFDEALGSWFLGPLFLGMASGLLLGIPSPFNVGLSLLLGTMVGATAGLAVITILMRARRKVRRRWRARLEARRTALLDTCERILAGRDADLSANGRRQRWLERMRAYA